MKVLSLLTLSFFLWTNGSQSFAQTQLSNTGFYQPRVIHIPEEEDPLRDKQEAVDNIKNLKNGALLVRLKTRQNTIDAFEERGYKKMAKQVKDQQLQSNKKLMETFQEHFDFCKVYFFYSNDSDKILEEDLSGIFLNDKMEKDASISINEEHIFIAEIGSIITDPSVTYRDGTESYATSGMSESILAIKNDEFEQLRKPFPYYVKAGERFLDKKIAKLNKRLHRFYSYWKK